MKAIGIFEAKAKLSEICENVALTHDSVTVTKRGRAIAQIVPIKSAVMTIRERREEYMAGPGKSESADADDFAPPERASDVSDFRLDDEP